MDILYYIQYSLLMPKRKPRSYSSPARQRQADDTRARIVAAAGTLLRKRGFDGATIEAIASAAGVSAQTVYSVFGSKRGIIAALFDQARFGPGYQELTAEALETTDPRVRLGFASRISRQIYDAERATLELLRGAGAVAPELAMMEREREDERRDIQAPLVRALAEAGALRPGLDVETAHDTLWVLTSRDVYRMMVIERGWTSARYERWLGEAIARELVAPTAKPKARA
jgi:AcrR family transcriptional regulator